MDEHVDEDEKLVDDDEKLVDDEDEEDDVLLSSDAVFLCGFGCRVSSILFRASLHDAIKKKVSRTAKALYGKIFIKYDFFRFVGQIHNLFRSIVQFMYFEQ